MTWQLHTGDARAVLATLAADSVDACVTDPPYELGFMGKKWDASGIANEPELWRAVLRVLKPGAHLLAFGGTRTYHRMVCAIEDAGFEIRDSIHWIYGSGFPKSLSVSKAIDAAAGAERATLGRRSDGRYATPMAVSGRSAGIMGDVVERLAPEITLPATDAAKQWDGWGTALKPGHEPIVLARKPLDGSVAANVQRWGTGAINIDGCRIKGGPSNGGAKAGATHLGLMNDDGWHGDLDRVIDRELAKGRWPANVLFSHSPDCTEVCAPGCPVVELDAQSGETKRSGGRRGGIIGDSGIYNNYAPMERANAGGLGDTGGASRFFYVAKPTRAERDAGCAHLPGKTAGEALNRKEGSAGLKHARAGANHGGAKNHHPTVKPIALMRYLIRLITPPGGLVLDPFAGSGTTGIAALQEGARFVGIDLEPEYARIAITRIEEDAPLFNRRRAP